MRKNEIIQINVRKGLLNKALDRLGVAVQYFPNYVNKKLRLHSVDTVLMSFILSGKGKHYLGDDVFDEEPGYLSITHYGQYHDIVTDSKGMDIMNIYIDMKTRPLPILPADLRQIIPEILPLDPCLQNKLNRMTRLFIGDHMNVAKNLFAMDKEIKEMKKGYEMAVTNYFTIFLIEICRAAINNGKITEKQNCINMDMGIELVRRHIDANFAKDHTLQSLAKFAGMSPEYLCRKFKKYTGKTVFGYLVQRRIQEALSRLRFTDEKISSIALETGFNDISYFIRKFKELTGKTPREYRIEQNLQQYNKILCEK